MTTELEHIDELISIAEEKKSKRAGIVIPLILFSLTILTTLASGALQQGLDIVAKPSNIIQGYPFSLAIIAILGTHELGHFFASRRHKVATTFPYFIPGPPIPPMIGTFGAVIRMKSPILKRAALIDIGAAGPIAGFLVSIAVAIWGLSLSPALPAPVEEGQLILGSSLIFQILSYLVIGTIPSGFEIYLHPVAFAGWIGFFITCLNLLPIGQLDGGHIIYGILDMFHRRISIIIVLMLIILGIITWHGWLVWAILVSIIGIGHPPVLDSHIPLDRKRRSIAFLTMVIFILTFIPTPIYII
jgi:membrane-associated protease RseP (regulator of RpoE activity)